MKNISKIITMAIAIILSVSFFGPFPDHTTAEACEEAPYARKDDTLTLIDEQDNLWDVEALNIDDNDFLLLWINDNDTDTVEDDTIIKVWREAY